MQSTPEQQQLIQKAKAAGERRLQIDFAPQQKTEWEAAVHEELASKDANIAHHQKIQAAAKQPGFFGDVRRAITHSRQPIHQLAEQLAISPRLLSDFRAGDAELPAPALNQLLDILGLRLMQEIPR